MIFQSPRSISTLPTTSVLRSFPSKSVSTGRHRLQRHDAIVIKHVDQDEPRQSNKILIIFYTTQIHNDSVMEQISVLPTEKKSILQHSACIFEDTAMDTTPKC